jgi:hypothetical protein
MHTEETKRRIHLTKTNKRPQMTLEGKQIYLCYDCEEYYGAEEMYKSDTSTGFGARCKECGLKYDSERAKVKNARKRLAETGLETFDRPFLINLTIVKVKDPKDLPRYGLLKAVFQAKGVYLSITDYAFLQGYFYSHE